MTTENKDLREKLQTEFKEHNITGTFMNLAIRSKFIANCSFRTSKGTFNESLKNLEIHMQEEHELYDDEHLVNILKANNSANITDRETANYTEIFNHIAQEINFVEKSLSNSSLCWNLSFIIFVFLTIK